MDRILKAIEQYKSNHIDFEEIRGWIIPCANALESELGYTRNNFMKDIENWFEYIEFCYKSKDKRELTLSLCSFIESLITKRISPIVLPSQDIVVKGHLLMNSS